MQIIILIVVRTMFSDPASDNKTCGEEDSAHRVFTLYGDYAQPTNCRNECDSNNKCIAFSAIWNDFCIGCDIELSSEKDGARGFKKGGEKYY